MFLLALLHTTLAHSANLPLNAKAVLVMDADTQEIIYEKRSSEVRPIASITKLMTAMVILDAELNMDDPIQITQEDVINTRIHDRDSSLSLPAGSTLTRDDMLRLTLMNSHNRAASSLARTYPGGTSEFVNQMNQKAESLGMTHTYYVDPTGLYDGNVSTAEDLAILLQTATSYLPIKAYSTTTDYSPLTLDKTFKTTNRLVRSDKWNIQVQKTGYIKSAGRCVVMMAELANKNIIIVLLDTTSSSMRARDAAIIKQWIEQGTIIKFSTKKRKTSHS